VKNDIKIRQEKGDKRDGQGRGQKRNKNERKQNIGGLGR